MPPLLQLVLIFESFKLERELIVSLRRQAILVRFFKQLLREHRRRERAWARLRLANAFQQWRLAVASARHRRAAAAHTQSASALETELQNLKRQLKAERGSARGWRRVWRLACLGLKTQKELAAALRQIAVLQADVAHHSTMSRTRDGQIQLLQAEVNELRRKLEDDGTYACSLASQ
jgi:hypothetical protein